MDLHRHLRSLALLILVLATCFSASQATHHKEMANNTEFVSVNYVVLDEQPDSGPWSEWSLPSPCSRSCGGGVAFQSRKCGLGSACQGPAKRYFSCNTMHCPPGSKDFRSEQCSKFDTQDFGGNLYEWIPYTKGANDCELYCMPRGKRFNGFTTKMVDGTRCNGETLDVCVEGRCMPVGCDLFLGSSLREDKCRDCGGNNSGCITVTEIISFETDLSDAEPGYNDLLLIPAGATNIFVRELKDANNYLAIRNGNNTYYLNGNLNINYPDDFHFAGTVFHYERQPNSFLLGSAVIRALGPTNESLYIALLYHEDRKGEGIEYEYSFSKEEQSDDSDNYLWVTHNFSECSSPCGGGSQNRTLGCAKKSDNSTVSLRLCNPVKRPAATQRCNEQETCDPEWFVSLWSQFRRVYCLQKISNRMTVIEDDVCVKKHGEKPTATQPSNEECNEGKQYQPSLEDHDTTAKTTESTTISSKATQALEPEQQTTSVFSMAYEAPHIYLPEPNVSVPEGGQCFLKCLTSGSPTPTLTWRKDDRIINGSYGRHRLLSDGSLQLIGVTRDDSGLYACSAENGVGEPVTREIQVEVTDGRNNQAVILNTEPVVRVNINTSAVLNCYAMGWPRPTITWWRSSSILPITSKKYEQRRDFALVIATVSYEDLGAYTCQAYNGLGRAVSWTFTLQGYKPPGSVFSGSETYHQFLVEPEVVRPPSVRPRIPLPLPEPTQITTALQIHPNCKDSPYYAQCKVIVMAKYCTHRYYSRFCCRSCTEDGQLPLDGAHLYSSFPSRK